MYIPIGISSPVGEHTHTAHIPDTRILHRPSSPVRWQAPLEPTQPHPTAPVGRARTPLSGRSPWAPLAFGSQGLLLSPPLPSFSLQPAFFLRADMMVSTAFCLSSCPAPLCLGQGFSVLFSDKSRPRSALPGEGGGWVLQLEPLSLHGAAGAPPPLGTQMGFIQQTNPAPPPQPHRHVDPGLTVGRGW